MQSQRIYLFSGPIGTRVASLAGGLSLSMTEIARLPFARPEMLEEVYALYLSAGADILLLATQMANKLGGVCRSDRECDIATDTVVNRGIAAMHRTGHNARLCAMLSLPDEMMRSRELESVDRQCLQLMQMGVDAFMCETLCSVDAAMYLADIVGNATAHTGINADCHISFFTKDGVSLADGNTLAQAVSRLALWHPASIGVNCVYPPTIAARALSELSDLQVPFSLRPAVSLPEEPKVSADSLATALEPLVNNTNLRYIGACCGSDESYIVKLRNLLPKYA